MFDFFPWTIFEDANLLASTQVYITSVASRGRLTSTRACIWLADWMGREGHGRKWRHGAVRRARLGVYRWLHAVTRKLRATYTGRQPQNRVMAPLCPRLSRLLKRTECLHANIFRGTSHGFYRRPHLWKRNLGAVGQLLPQHPPARSFAASAHGSSSDGRDVTEKLWSVYHETKSQTEGI